MRPIIYYVATSLDGYICGPNADISGFVATGKGVEQYLQDLQAFDTVIMGRKTYEFGYEFGLQPGQPAYPQMRHFIFSKSLTFTDPHEKVKVCPLDLSIIRDLKAEEGSPIYLCGGGEFAGWLLDHQLIDILKIKLNPFIQGAGVPLFGSSTTVCQTRLVDTQQYEEGLQIITYQLEYPK